METNPVKNYYPPYDRNKDYTNRYYTPSIGMETVRILRPDKGKAIKKVFLHPYKCQGKFLKLHCLKHNDGEYCPFCEWEEKLVLLSNQRREKIVKGLTDDMTTTQKNNILQPATDTYELSLVYKAKPYYVVELIKRAVDKNNKPIPGSVGSKKMYWCFGESYNENGPLDIMNRLARQFGDITDPINGRDIILVHQKNKNNYLDLINIVAGEESSAFYSQEESMKVYNDNFSWKDLYKPKSFGNITHTEYMLAVRENKLPEWDSENRVWKIEGMEQEEPKLVNANYGDYVSTKNMDIDEIL